MTELKMSPDLARVLVDEGMAETGQIKRSSLPEILTEGAPAAATIISLLQGPMTVAQIAHWLRHWRSNRSNNDGILSIQSSKGSLRIVIDSETDLEKVAPVIRDLLFPDGDEPPDAPSIDI